MNSKRVSVVAIVSILAILAFLAASTLGAQQPRLSPAGTAEFTLNGKKITVAYSRPSMRGRKIFGQLVPYDKVWRTGANEATSFTTEADLVLGGVTIPKGSYTLFTIPSVGGWKLIINKQTGQWGTEYDGSQDLARIDIKVESLNDPIEQFTISIAPTGKGGVMKLEWENTRASVEFSEKK
ncbi:MAG: DUF2911 domain-containing protein [Acidobacteria bacterium]|nr:DUF2911 domain-containing protein [Acidobacteriota bacterium]